MHLFSAFSQTDRVKNIAVQIFCDDAETHTTMHGGIRF